MASAFSVCAEPHPLVWEPDGAERYDGAAAPILGRLLSFAQQWPGDRAGVRIANSDPLRALLSLDGPIGILAASRLGGGCRSVRAILFDKSARQNWSLGWHQDRTICVRERWDTSGFGPWTVKRGIQHVEPPFALLKRMVTLRVHLDDVGIHNAPLLIAPGSHRLGRIPETAIDAAVRRCGHVACTARAGDVWLYSTPILHASERARQPARRRVLQIDFSADDLPTGLEWAGI